MSSSGIRAHSFNPHHRAIGAIDAAIRKLDTDLRGLARRTDMYPAEKVKRESEIRAAGLASIEAARKQLVAAVAEDRETAKYTEPAPSGEALTRRAYYAQQAASELAGLAPRDALALVQSVAAAGDDERSREYVRASRGVLSRSDPAAWKTLELKVEPRDVKMHRSFGAAVKSVEDNMSWADRWISESTANAGKVSQAEKEGREDPEQDPLRLRQLHLWLDGARKGAAVALERSAAAQDGVEPAAWAQRGAEPAAASGDGAASGAGDGS